MPRRGGCYRSQRLRSYMLMLQRNAYVRKSFVFAGEPRPRSPRDLPPNRRANTMQAMGIASPFAPRRATDGFVLVAVLWILGALATLGSIYAAYLGSTVTGLRVNDDRLQTDALVSAAIE